MWSPRRVDKPICIWLPVRNSILLAKAGGCLVDKLQ